MSQQHLDIDVETRSVTRLLEVNLQPAELGAIGVEAGQLSGEYATAKGAYDLVKKENSVKLKGIDAKLQAALDKLQKKTESREVECVEKRFFSTNTIQVWDGDNLVEERAMTVEERQMTFGEAKNGVVMEAEDPRPSWPPTEEEQKADLLGVMRDERNPNKPSVVDFN